MGRSSKSITLALIGSALFLAGCQPEATPEPDDEPVGAGADWGDDQPAEGQAVAAAPNTNGNGVPHRGGMPLFIPIPIGGGGMRGGAPAGPRPGAGVGSPSAPSARGGFGSTGGSAVS